MSTNKECDKLCMKRRDALKLGASATALALVSSEATDAIANLSPKTVAFDGPSSPGYVVRVHKPGMLGRNFPHADAAKEMVNKAVTTLAKTGDLKAAWSKFIKKDDRVGIKINVLGGRLSSTMKEVVDPIIEGVRLVGVPDENIMVFDQFGGNMKAARYAWQEKPGLLRVINHTVLGYEKDIITSEGGGKGRLAKTLTWSTAVINVPVLKDHDSAGVTCAMKNMVFGCVERPPMMHQTIHTAIPHFYAREEIRGRVKLIICDGSFCLFDGGPKHNPKAHIAHDCVYATTDPVAMDRIALEVVEEYRAKKKMRSLDKVRRPATYLELAEEIGLGIANREKIKIEAFELAPVQK